MTDAAQARRVIISTKGYVMGLIVKKDETEHEVIEGIEIIERSDTPDDLPENPVELVTGASAEDIAAGTNEAVGDGDTAAADDASGEDVEAADGGDDDSEDGGVEGRIAGDRGPDGSDADDDADEGADAAEAASVDADDAEDGSEGDASSRQHEGGPLSQVPHGVIAGAVVLMLVVAVVAAVIGYVVGSGGFGGTGTGSVTVDEGQLDTVIASYSYNGATHDITVRSAIEDERSLDAAQNDDGTYSVPASETIIKLVRNDILVAEAESRGIDVSDDEMAEFAESMVGTSDYGTLADQYGVSEDQAKEIVRENALIQKLYDQVVPEASDLSAPSEPTAPENGDESTSSADYAAYIIGLAGDEWDASTNSWASTDGPYYQALGDAFTGDTATYEQAVTAYYVAYQQYSSQATEVNDTWTAFSNQLYANANIRLYGLYI